MKSRLLLLCCGLCAALVSPAAAQPDAKAAHPLSHLARCVPPDARLIIASPDLQQLSDRIRAFGKAGQFENLADFSIERAIAEPLGEFADLIKPSGGAIIAFGPRHSGAILIAERKPDAAWPPASATQPASNAPIHALGELGFAALRPAGVLIFARERQDVQRALEGDSAIGQEFLSQHGDLLDRSQIVLHVSVPAWKRFIERGIQMSESQIHLGMAMAGPEAEPGIRMWRWIFARMRDLTRQAKTYTAAARIDAEGVFLEDRATFATDGSVYKYLQSVERPERDLLRGLPAGPFAAVYSAEWEGPPDMPSINESLARVVLTAESLRSQLDAEQLEAAIERSIVLQRRLTGYSFVFTHAAEAKNFVYYGLHFTEKPAEMCRSLTDIFNETPDLLSAWGPFKTTGIRHERESVADVQADVFHLNITADDARMQAFMPVCSMDDATVYMAPLPEGVFQAIGGQSEARSLLASMLASDKTTISQMPRVVALREKLTPHPQAILVVDLARMFGSLTLMMRSAGMPFPELQLPAGDGPLIGYTFYLDPQRVRSELYLPTAPLRDFVRAARQVNPGPR